MLCLDAEKMLKKIGNLSVECWIFPDSRLRLQQETKFKKKNALNEINLETKRSDICEYLFYFLRNSCQLSGDRVFGLEITFLIEK